MLRSVITMLCLSIRYGCADVTISAVEPEKHLYFLWLPFIKVVYILHSEPHSAMAKFSIFTCNSRLGSQKQIITVSGHMRRLIIDQWGIKSARARFVKVIYNCILEAGFKKNSENRKSDRKLSVLTLGSVDIRKNPQAWFDVAKTVTSSRSEIEFIWLGNGNLLDLFSKKTESTPQIKFLGLIDNPQPYFEKCAIYYQPSLIEPHGIAVVEAMYNELPCIVANIGGMAESVQHGFNGILVDPKDLAGNVNAITTLLDNAELRRNYGRNSLKRFNELFTFNKFKNEMDEVYYH